MKTGLYAEAKTLATWVDEYGTGSGPGSPDGQPGWGGGSDRLQPTIHKPFNAPAAARAKRLASWDDEYGTGSGSDRTKLRYTQKQWTMNFGDKVFELNRAPGRYRSRF